VGNSAKVAKEVGIEHFVLVSSALVTPKNRFVVATFDAQLLFQLDDTHHVSSISAAM
jgi:hypothetical protein